ncbi:MAG: ribbon-helix-helix domain-containing protein [Pyrinomonadaceae bacterium]|nr:ribbon-helix-helix domain-containing protein [Pyrinomonadaceae bacterium]
MAIATLNISLPDTMKAEVENVVATEGYGNTSEFFRDLVRDYLKERQARKLEALILEGIGSGESTALTKGDFEKIKERGIKRLRQRTQK